MVISSPVNIQAGGQDTNPRKTSNWGGSFRNTCRSQIGKNMISEPVQRQAFCELYHVLLHWLTHPCCKGSFFPSLYVPGEEASSSPRQDSDLSCSTERDRIAASCRNCSANHQRQGLPEEVIHGQRPRAPPPRQTSLPTDIPLSFQIQPSCCHPGRKPL